MASFRTAANRPGGARSLSRSELDQQGYSTYHERYSKRLKDQCGILIPHFGLQSAS